MLTDQDRFLAVIDASGDVSYVAIDANDTTEAWTMFLTSRKLEYTTDNLSIYTDEGFHMGFIKITHVEE